MSQMIRGRPFQIINRRDQPWFQPAALLHLRGRQSFAPLTATRLGQVLKRAGFRFEPMELLDVVDNLNLTPPVSAFTSSRNFGTPTKRGTALRKSQAFSQHSITSPMDHFTK